MAPYLIIDLLKQLDLNEFDVRRRDCGNMRRVNELFISRG